MKTLALGILSVLASVSTFAADKAPATDTAHDHTVILGMVGAESDMIVYILKGSFDCKPKQHRAVVEFKTNDLVTVYVGCAVTTNNDELVVTLDNGQQITLSKDKGTSPKKSPANET